jgi:hypothetical protein
VIERSAQARATPDTETPTLAAAPTRAAPPAAILALQRTAGNAAVVSLLAARRSLARGPVKTEDLDRQFKEYVDASDWAGVSGTLLRYADDAEVTQRLRTLTVWEIIALGEHLPPGDHPFGLRALIEQVRVAKRDAAYAAALSGFDRPVLIRLLDAYDDAAMLEKGHEIQRLKDKDGIAACQRTALLWPGRDRRVARMFAFLPLEDKTGAATRPASSAVGVDTGPAAGPDVKVAGGSVKDYETAKAMGETGFFGFDYEGADAAQTGWLQFIAHEAEMFDAKGTSLDFEKDTPTEAEGQSEKREWGTTAAPIWALDALSDVAPFYEAKAEKGPTAGQSGGHDTSPSQTAIYDAPNFPAKVARAALARDPDGGKVDHVALRLRFHLYLVRGMAVLYENTMVVEFVARRGDTAAPAAKNTAGKGATASKLQSEHFDALVRRFPKWSFYPH